MIICGVHWKNECSLGWEGVLVFYSILFLVNWMFAWYIQKKLNVVVRKEAPIIEVAKGKLMIVFYIWFLLQIIFNVIMGVLWDKDDDHCVSFSLLFQENSLTFS